MPSSSSRLRESVLAARERLAAGRERTQAQHTAGTPSVQICARLSSLLDEVVLELFRQALADLELEHLREQVAVIALGGSGRRDVAPFSDTDLMILEQGAQAEEVKRLATRLVQDLFDAGLAPGPTVRSIADALQMAQTDVVTLTALIEARPLVGNEAIYNSFRQRFRRMVERRYRTVHEAIVTARRAERQQYGETVYLLMPNLKRSRGGLREIQLLRWIGYARFGVSDLDSLQLAGALSKHDLHVLRSATDFLLRVRNEMHFHAGRSQDVLDREQQVRLASVFGYLGREGVLPVEQFMQEYFRHTSNVQHLVSRFVNSVAPTPAVQRVLEPMFSRQENRDYRVGVREIVATRFGLEKLRDDVGEVLRLADLANAHNKRIAHATWDAVSRAAPHYPSDLTPEIAERFLSLLAEPARLARLLQQLHELRVLEKIIPAFGRARGLLQFNDYHKYTVDEHSFRAVRNATEFADRDDTLGQVYRSIKDKRVLHLALLTHDLGKGYAEDHSDVGARIAEDTCRRLGMNDEQTQTVRFLVQHHLAMSHLAFRRDTSDERVVLRFAVDVGSLDVLKMLYVLTCADLAAVGPGVLNHWKSEVLAQLYHQTMQYLAGDVEQNTAAWALQRREAIEQSLANQLPDATRARHLEALPAAYLRANSPDQAAQMLTRLQALSGSQVDAWGEYQEESQTVRFTAIAPQGHGRGLFSRLTGSLSSQGLEILTAEIHSLADDAVLDQFTVRDLDFATPSDDRIAQVSERLILDVSKDEPPTFRKLWGADQAASSQKFSTLASQVQVDNATSDEYTILDVFTFDRVGLLYEIARTLYELELSIGAAKIGTHLDQVVDVFYVKDKNSGAKIEDSARVAEIRQRLLAAVAATEPID